MKRGTPVVQDSSLPDFWESRYRDNVIPWDAGKVPALLQDFARNLASGTKVLIPGCGSAYEAAYLSKRGCDVLAIDFSPAAIAAARQNLAGLKVVLHEADFFNFDFGRPFDIIYERAFLCALPRKMWRAYADRCAHLLKARGTVAGFFYFADAPKGPPFGTSHAELDSLLKLRFDRVDDQPVADSIAIFASKERWQVWRRR